VCESVFVFHIADVKGGNDSELSFPHDGLSFYPARGDVDTVQGIDKLSGR
jgi:hypothetical protein